ncbi:acetate kinase [Hymenobacter lutimineralis]|uniref:Acetate kinase n=1 Tax=Hymenobacter lutimineralis TaxID=2606448 RepID=A0A5D6UVI0_9BACT|nr:MULTISPECIES: acetate kinase [Hymenobacter]QIX62309.1 acetate kinase [Hymenobacter sp. BT18]TYZ06908.1 acetate kinase [Hymenobacter lutimineralis]
MHIFVINSGSSSIKYQLFRWPQERPVCSGLVERIGADQATITHKVFALDAPEMPATEQRLTLPLPNHEAGLREVVRLLTAAPNGVIQDPADIAVVGHRVVHGGEAFAATTLITQAVKTEIRRLFALAPLHNPANLLGIDVAEQLFPQARQVAVFDTAFHQTLPEYAFRYALPEALYTEQRIRKYGFHGTSHQYVAAQATAYLGLPDARLITVHLGNGCSVAAVRGGLSLDTSMGFGPLAGLVMGTRTGDLDPSVLLHLLGPLGYSPEQVSTLLNKESGMLGLTGSSDMRDIGAALAAGDARAQLAYDLYAYRIRQYIGAYVAVLGGLDAVVFTAGVGENDALVRRLACQDMGFFGLELDEAANQQRIPGLREISLPSSRAKILVVPTNEELEIARQCAQLLA